jgi:hypothetical protein
MRNFHLVQRLAERKGRGCVVADGKERRCAHLALIFGLVHLLANIPIWRGRKGLEAIEEVCSTISVCVFRICFLNGFPLTSCALSPVCLNIPLPLAVHVRRHFTELPASPRMHLRTSWPDFERSDNVRIVRSDKGSNLCSHLQRARARAGCGAAEARQPSLGGSGDLQKHVQERASAPASRLDITKTERLTAQANIDNSDNK